MVILDDEPMMNRSHMLQSTPNQHQSLNTSSSTHHQSPVSHYSGSISAASMQRPNQSYRSMNRSSLHNNTTGSIRSIHQSPNAASFNRSTAGGLNASASHNSSVYGTAPDELSHTHSESGGVVDGTHEESELHDVAHEEEVMTSPSVKPTSRKDLPVDEEEELEESLVEDGDLGEGASFRNQTRDGVEEEMEAEEVEEMEDDADEVMC